MTIKEQAEGFLYQCSDDPEINVWPNWPDEDMAKMCQGVIILADAPEDIKFGDSAEMSDIAEKALKQAEEI